jgi:Zn-dependent peptidase ImmA (M78 family)
MDNLNQSGAHAPSEEQEEGRFQVNPEMIILAREIRGITQAELARRLGASQGKISKMEDGLLGVSSSDLQALAATLNLPTPFFSRTDIPRNVFNGFYYRKRVTLPQKFLTQFNAKVCLRLARIERLLRKVEIDRLPLPSCDPDEYRGGPAEVAGRIRQFLHIPPGPIRNLTDRLENIGVFVVEEDFGTTKLDGVSAFTRNLTPVIFLNTAYPRSRRIFTAVHELAHCVMHRSPRPRAEDESNEFTAEFLLPTREIVLDFKTCGEINLDNLGRLKLKWHVSIGALLKRALMLDFVTQGRFTYLRSLMSKQGYQRDEPHESMMGARRPQLETELLEVHLNELGYSPGQLKEILDMNPEDSEFEETYYPAGLPFSVVR